MNLHKEQKSTKKNHIIFILDESGSMKSRIKETLQGINEQIQELKKPLEGIETRVTFVTFSGTRKILFSNVLAEKVSEITDEEYKPDGSTAMYDAVGQTLSQIMELDDKETQFLVMIVSDGEENASTSVYKDPSRIAKMITDCKNTKRWVFSYMGANQDLSVVKEGLSIGSGCIATYSTASAADVTRGMSQNTLSLNHYRKAVDSTKTLGTLESFSFYAPNDREDYTISTDDDGTRIN